MSYTFIFLEKYERHNKTVLPNKTRVKNKEMKQVLLILMLFLCSCEVDSGVEIIDLRGTVINEIPNSVFKNTKLKELHIGSDGYTLYQ